MIVMISSGTYSPMRVAEGTHEAPIEFQSTDELSEFHENFAQTARGWRTARLAKLVNRSAAIMQQGAPSQ